MKVQLRRDRPARSCFALLFVLTVARQSICAQPTVAGGAGSTHRAEIELAIAARMDSLQWSIPGSGGYPNILSELTWWGLLSAGATIRGRYAFGPLAFVGEGGIFKTFTGRNTDYDYLADDRTSVLAYSENSSNGGLTADLKLGVGYDEYETLGHGRAHFALVGGPFMSAQNLLITDGTQYPGAIVLAGISSTYNTLWWGPWIGFTAGHESPNGSSFSGTLEALFVLYSGTADWMRRTDFAHPVSFRQWAAGGGLMLHLEAATATRNHFRWVFRAGVGFLTTATGTDQLYYANGSDSTGTLNGATWTTISLSAGLSFVGF
ncbi:MAG TPA: hypothetical protein VMW87_07100 [Spirochaetia bacterium]|nr:hypothetical protein [Spirochaetia bacterium]